MRSECEQFAHDLTVGVDDACRVCGMPHDEAMRDMGFELENRAWAATITPDQPRETLFLPRSQRT